MNEPTPMWKHVLITAADVVAALLAVVLVTCFGMLVGIEIFLPVLAICTVTYLTWHGAIHRRDMEALHIERERLMEKADE